MFINAELDMCFGYGWNGGPEFSTRIVTTKSWVERRNAQNIECRHSYSLPLANIHNREYLITLKQTFLACRGQLHSFKIKDYSDFQADDEVFGLGDGATKVFQLRKDSTFGIATYTRFITKPNDGVVVKVNGANTTVVIDALTGIVTFSVAPVNDAIITWTGEFRVPVRFNSDILSNSIDNLFGNGEYAMSGSIELIEVFKE